MKKADKMRFTIEDDDTPSKVFNNAQLITKEIISQSGGTPANLLNS